MFTSCTLSSSKNSFNSFSKKQQRVDLFLIEPKLIKLAQLPRLLRTGAYTVQVYLETTYSIRELRLDKQGQFHGRTHRQSLFIHFTKSTAVTPDDGRGQLLRSSTGI